MKAEGDGLGRLGHPSVVGKGADAPHLQHCRLCLGATSCKGSGSCLNTPSRWMFGGGRVPVVPVGCPPVSTSRGAQAFGVPEAAAAFMCQDKVSTEWLLPEPVHVCVCVGVLSV